MTFSSPASSSGGTAGSGCSAGVFPKVHMTYYFFDSCLEMKLS